MKKSKLTTKQIVLTGMMTAVLAVLSIVTIPLPTGVPVTLQTFAMAFCGYVLGWKLGGASSALYLILGAIGVPVYAGMSGGFGALLGPAGGFIFGFILLAVFCGLKRDKLWLNIIFSVIGLALCHLCGTIQYMLLANMEFIPAFLLVSAPYLIKDIISIGVAKWVAILMTKATAKIKKS